MSHEQQGAILAISLHAACGDGAKHEREEIGLIAKTLGGETGARDLPQNQPLLLPADHLLAHPPGGPQRRAHGAGHYRGGQAGFARRLRAARRNQRQLRTLRGAGQQRHHPRPSALPADADPDPARRVHQIGAIPLPFPAPQRDGGADTSLGLPAFGDHGLGLHEVLVALFLFITAPLSAHLLAKAALHQRLTSLAPPPETTENREDDALPAAGLSRAEPGTRGEISNALGGAHDTRLGDERGR